jgi:hypothetical protein
MMLSREVRRVPLDFDWPVDKTWGGYLMPDELRPPPCQCGGDGYSPWAQQMNKTWYSLDLPVREREEYRWDNKLTQFDVDVLVRKGRLNPVINCPQGCKRPEKSGPGWQTDCPDCGGRGWTRRQLEVGDISAEDYNRHAREDPFRGDSIDRYVIIQARCEVLGVSHTCEWCDGDGVGGTDEQRLRYETWVPTKPPTGDAYQLWQTVSEGGPCSPPFATVEELACWLSANDTSILEGKTVGEWLKILGGEVQGTDIQTGALV